ncbi:DUF4136 domain-containing protein [Marinicella sp. W31]|uniref:DUF4136 domain-containing protein n=1 Tax=Marinicella sp. W31 TaxID=3023713 RepID=UPI0037575B46
MKLKIYSVAMICILLSGCGSMIRPETRYDEGIDFSDYSSFTWLNTEPLLLAPDAVNPAVVTALEQALINALQSRGHTFTTDLFNADLIVSFALESTDQTYDTTLRHQAEDPDVCTPPISVDQLSAGADTAIYQEQFMMLNIFDNARCINVWHGRIETTFDMFDEVAGQRQKITKTVDLLLSDYPPE